MRKPRKLRSRKAGLPPGSLVHIGEIKTERPILSAFDFGPDALTELGLADTDALRNYTRRHALLWVNVYGIHDAGVLGEIGDIFGLHPLVVEDILNTAQRQKLDIYKDYLYLVLHRYEFVGNGQDLAQDQISLVIGRDFVLSFQERRSKLFEPVRQRLRADRGSLRRGDVDTLVYSLLDAMVDSYFGIVERLNETAEELEELILGRPSPSVLEGIHHFKRQLSQLRRNLHPLREVLTSLQRDAGDFFRPEIQVYLRDVHDHALHILESLEDMRDLATGLLDVYLSTVSQRVNLEVRTLTVVATLFMPASLIAGIFGMNFKLMPWLDLDRGFAYSLGLMAAVALVMLLLFWRRRCV